MGAKIKPPPEPPKLAEVWQLNAECDGGRTAEGRADVTDVYISRRHNSIMVRAIIDGSGTEKVFRLGNFRRLYQRVPVVHNCTCCGG
jgi:hypothetical protein